MRKIYALFYGEDCLESNGKRHDREKAKKYSLHSVFPALNLDS